MKTGTMSEHLAKIGTKKQRLFLVSESKKLIAKYMKETNPKKKAELKIKIKEILTNV